MRKYLFILFIIFITTSIFAQNIEKYNPYYKSEINNFKKENMLSLFFFSDLHGDGKELARYCEFLNRNPIFDDAICTGDMVQLSLESDWTFYDKVPGSEKILLSIGNHDVRHGLKQNDKKTKANQKDTYNKFFKPYIANWNVYYREGYTQYYKDYNDKKIRLIVLDPNLKSKELNTQLHWFNGVLRSALSKKYSVICASHLHNNIYSQKIDCSYNSNVKSYSGDKKYEPYLKAVADFQNRGGDFICWLGGHIHKNLLTYDKIYNQLAITVSVTDRLNRARIYDELNGKKSKKPIFKENREGRNRDCANILLIDTKNKLIKIIPIGHHSKETNWIVNYKTFKIVK